MRDVMMYRLREPFGVKELTSEPLPQYIAPVREYAARLRKGRDNDAVLWQYKSEHVIGEWKSTPREAWQSFLRILNYWFEDLLTYIELHR